MFQFVMRFVWCLIVYAECDQTCGKSLPLLCHSFATYLAKL